MSLLFSNRDCAGCALLEVERDQARAERDETTKRAAAAERACERLNRELRQLRDEMHQLSSTADEASRQMVQRLVQLESVLEHIFDGQDVEDFAARRELGLRPIIAARKFKNPNEAPYDPDRPSRRFELIDVD